MRSKLVFELQYLGDAFAGWQPQPNERSVHDVFAAALSNAGITDCGAVAAGRTDRGVNAAHQVVSVRSDADRSDEDLSALLRDVSAALPGDVRVLTCRRAPASFHVITSARSKRYAYYLGFSDDAARYAWPAPPGLDVGRVRRGAALLVGERDFRAFCAPGGRKCGSTVRRLRAVDVEFLEAAELPFVGRVRGLLRIAFDGDGFLKHQCRKMVGALVRLGTGALAEAQVEAALADPRGAHPAVSSRRFAAPARGLWLERVDCAWDEAAHPS